MSNINPKTKQLLVIIYVFFALIFGKFSQVSAQVSQSRVNLVQTESNMINMEVTVPAGEKISGVDLELNSSDVNFTKIGPIQCLDKSKNYVDIINQASGKKARLVSVLFEKSTDLCASLSIPLQFVGEARGTVTLNNSASQISGTGQNLVYNISSNILQLGKTSIPEQPLPPDDDPFEPLPPAQQNGDINVRFSPNTLNLGIGQTATQYLVLRSANGVDKISAWEINLEYTSSRAKIVSVGGKSKLDFEGQNIEAAEERCTALEKQISPNKSSVRLSYTCLLPDDELPTSVQIPIVLSGVSAGTSQTRISEVEVVGNSSENYTIGKGVGTVLVGSGKNVPDPEDPDTSVGGSSVNLNMSFRLQGVPTRPQKPRPVKMKIGFGDGGMAKPKYVNGTFNFDENGLLRGNVATSLPSLQNLKILAKCAHCIQKKICDLNPSESVAGIYVCDKGKIPLRSGSNTLDFSTILLLAGDLGEQDGITNSLDVALVRNNFGKTDEAALAIADLNFDGEVNTQDYALIIRALSVKRDEP